MRLLSIDLPWGNDNVVAAAWVDVDEKSAPIEVMCLPAPAKPLHDPIAWTPVLTRIGQRADVILVDQPMGMPSIKGSARTSYRPVEQAWGNRFFFLHPSVGRIQFPRFQPGNAHCMGGLLRGAAALDSLGTKSGIALEGFPQLLIPVLLAHASGLSIDAVTRLASHKNSLRTQRAASQEQLLPIIEAFTGRPLRWCPKTNRGDRGSSDMVDAALGLIALLGLTGRLPPGRPEAVVLQQPKLANALPANAAEVVANSGTWWSTPASWLAASPEKRVRDDGIVALRWW
jgi:hypothetical protein